MRPHKTQDQAKGKNGVVPYRNLVAPLVLALFAVAWYQFSVVYIQGANLQLVQHNNLAVYVPIQQLRAYITALRNFTYVTVSAASVFFLYYVTKFFRLRSARAS